MPFEMTISGLSKTYSDGVQALSGASLTIPTGMFGPLGPNGAGKSTLMRTLATLQEADAGTVRLGTIDVLRDKDAVRRTLGYLPQDFGVYPKVSAAIPEACGSGSGSLRRSSAIRASSSSTNRPRASTPRNASASTICSPRSAKTSS
jgi:ABC-type Fe3+/spermidine/putrescine transport system ATPase subunit